MWLQKHIQLSPKKRGFHLITSEVRQALPEIRTIKCGLLHIFAQHTSASLTINENADPDVREDMEAYFSKTVPENEPYFRHTLEGSDDMPAHLKSTMIGCQLTVPVGSGRLLLGTWQGIYLCEHRDHAGSRSVIVTLTGELNND
jgi:secondary thiamine-phosphate synthase enzyme